MPTPGAAILGGAGIEAAGGLISSAINIGQARSQMRFQERMSNTAYQRSMADMKAAGLNPMMMYGKGGPASTPGGAAAQVENVAKGAGAAGAAYASNKIQNAQLTNATLVAQADVKLREAQARLTDEQALTQAVEREAKTLGLDYTSAQILTEGARYLTEQWKAKSEEARAKVSGFEATFYAEATKVLKAALGWAKGDKDKGPTSQSVVDALTPGPIKDALRSFTEWLFGDEKNRAVLIDILKALGKAQSGGATGADRSENRPREIPGRNVQ